MSLCLIDASSNPFSEKLDKYDTELNFSLIVVSWLLLSETVIN